MFGLVAGLYQKYMAPCQLNILLIGKQGAGKSTLLERIKVTQFHTRPISKKPPRKRRSLCPAPSKYAVKLSDQEEEYLIRQESETKNGSRHNSNSMEDISLEEEEEDASSVAADDETEYDVKPGAQMLPLDKIRPTIGMNLARVDICGAKCHFWDLGGKMQDLWSKYYKDAHAVIYVVGESNENQAELIGNLRSIRKELSKEIPLLVFWNFSHTKSKIQPQSVLQAVTNPHEEDPDLVSFCIGSAKTGQSVKVALENLVSVGIQQLQIRNRQQQQQV